MCICITTTELAIRYGDKLNPGLRQRLSLSQRKSGLLLDLPKTIINITQIIY